MKRKIVLNGRSIEYDLRRKKVKNINLRIKRDMSVLVSANERVPIATVEAFIQSKSTLILRALDKYKEFAKKADVTQELKDGDNIQFFGNMLQLKVIEDRTNRAEIAGELILLRVKDISSTELKKKTLLSLFDPILREKITQLCKAVYPTFAKTCGTFPELRFRHMRSRWGSCAPQKGILTFNYSLVHAPEDCIEYVVYHEFTHFLHPNHSKSFYASLSRHIPDYKERKKRLEQTPIL